MEVQINKSPNDDREYRYIILDNQLECMIVKDKDTQKSAACLDVRVGAALDPKDTPGLAHFLEHMLFMGTEKYPEENVYTKFISDNGGSDNAFTTLENTNYHFDVSNEGFEKALDMFAQFFICPLFDKNSVEKEMKAVDSEFKNSLQSDPERYYQIFQSESNPDSAFNRFTSGSLETLSKEGIIEELKAFHTRWYSANVMKLCIYSNRDLDDMEAIIRDLFTPIVNKHVEVPSFTDPPAYSEENLGNFYRVKPVLDENELNLCFWYPCYEKDYYYEVLTYLRHIFGHEGENSLLSALIKKDLATDIIASYDHILHAFSYFDINITLTDKGFDNYEEVLEIVWARIHDLKKTGPLEYVFNEYSEN